MDNQKLTPRQQIYYTYDIIELIYSFAITSYRIRFTNDVLPYIDKGWRLVKRCSGYGGSYLCNNCYLYNDTCKRDHHQVFTDFKWMSYHEFSILKCLYRVDYYYPPFHFYLDFKYFSSNKNGKKNLLKNKKIHIMINKQLYKLKSIT